MSSDNRRKMHVNSLLSYWEGEMKWFGKREAAVLAAIARLRRASDREVMLALGFNDMNSVRPRITELVNEGVLIEVGEQDDPVTKRPVRVLAIAADPRKAQRQFNFTTEETIQS